MNLNRHGYFPMQCDGCGRELINMGCNKCSPYKPPITPREARLARWLEEINRGGFPKLGQPSLSTLTLPASQGGDPPPSPRKRAFIIAPPTPFRQVLFKGDNERQLKLSDGKSLTGPSMTNGHHRPFAQRVKEGEIFDVLTKFEWGPHQWETLGIDCHRNTMEYMLFNSLCIHFSKFLKESVRKKECSNSRVCLCGGSNSSVTEEDVVILGYDLFDMNESFTIIVKAGVEGVS